MLALTLLLGGLLAFVATSLKPRQVKQVEIDTKYQILKAVRPELTKADDVLGLYDDMISSIVVDMDGRVVEQTPSGDPVVAEKINIERQFKVLKEIKALKAASDRSRKAGDVEEAEASMQKAASLAETVLLPLFRVKGDGSDKFQAYIVPTWGNGLWNSIWGYVALEEDLNTIRGISLDHRGETPGLGARITSQEVQQRYVDEKIYNAEGELVSVDMLKGEGNAEADQSPHLIDGLSGATITARGVNTMLKDYFGYYQPFFNTIESGGPVAIAN